MSTKYYAEAPVWCGVVWCGVVWCGVVWSGVEWSGVEWSGVEWSGVVWCLCVENITAFWFRTAPCTSPSEPLCPCYLCIPGAGGGVGWGAGWFWLVLSVQYILYSRLLLQTPVNTVEYSKSSEYSAVLCPQA
jgi:hypothetical protein